MVMLTGSVRAFLRADSTKTPSARLAVISERSTVLESTSKDSKVRFLDSASISEEAGNANVDGAILDFDCDKIFLDTRKIHRDAELLVVAYYVMVVHGRARHFKESFRREEEVVGEPGIEAGKGHGCSLLLLGVRCCFGSVRIEMVRVSRAGCMLRVYCPIAGGVARFRCLTATTASIAATITSRLRTFGSNLSLHSRAIV